MKYPYFYSYITVLILFIVLISVSGCTAQSSAVHTFKGKTFSVEYPSDWQAFDAYTLYNVPESDRNIIPEAVIFAPSMKYPTPVAIGVYTYSPSDPFGKQEAETKLHVISQARGTQFSYLGSITISGEQAFAYRSSDPNGNPVKNILFRNGSRLYYIQSYEAEKNLGLLIQSFKILPS